MDFVGFCSNCEEEPLEDTDQKSDCRGQGQQWEASREAPAAGVQVRGA